MIDRDQSLGMLMMMFPLAKVQYLMDQVLGCQNDDDFEDLVERLVENPTYPLKEVTSEAEEFNRQFRIEPFDVFEFLKEYMYDPLKHFAGLDRDMNHKALALDYLKKRFKPVREEYIEMTLRQANFNLMEAADALRNPPPSQILPRDRPVGHLPDDLDTTNWPISFKREVQFFEHKSEVMEYLEIVKEMKNVSVKEKTNLSCECCYDDDILNEEAVACQGGHVFCVSCVVRHVETQDNKPDVFNCIFFQFCSYRFSDEILQKCFTPGKILEINNNWQKELLRRAEIPGLESCPFCDYAAVADPDDLVFICLKCSIKSCRRAYHSPLDCNGVARNPPPRAPQRNECSNYPQASTSGVGHYRNEPVRVLPTPGKGNSSYAGNQSKNARDGYYNRGNRGGYNNNRGGHGYARGARGRGGNYYGANRNAGNYNTYQQPNRGGYAQTQYYSDSSSDDDY